MKRNIKKPNLSVVLYVVSVLMAAYAIFTLYTSTTYISNLAKAGSIAVKDQLGDIIGYYITNSMPYIFYAIVIWAIGYIINKLNVITNYINPQENEEDIIEE